MSLAAGSTHVSTLLQQEETSPPPCTKHVCKPLLADASCSRSQMLAAARCRPSMERGDGDACLTIHGAAAPVLASQLGQQPGLEALPDALLHHVMSMLALHDTLRLRAVSRGLAAAVRTLPGGLFAELSVVLADGSLDAEWCAPHMQRWVSHELIHLPCSAGYTSGSVHVATRCSLACAS